MANFNLVLHDMMLFVEDGRHCDILIPEIKEHDYRYGDPKTHISGMAAFPKNLPPDDYELKGIPVRHQPDRFRDHADSYLVLKKSQSMPVPGLRRIGIRVPLPDEIHLFRQVIPDSTALSVAQTVLNGTPEEVAVKLPTKLFTVVVFHYRDIDRDKIAFGRKAHHPPLVVRPETLCIYSQTGKDFFCMHLTSMKHRTGVNDLVHLTTGSHPTFELSKIGMAQDEPNPGLGLDPVHMLDLFQLMNLENDEGGCDGAAISEAD
jgi:hypothetical protein